MKFIMLLVLLLSFSGFAISNETVDSTEKFLGVWIEEETFKNRLNNEYYIGHYSAYSIDRDGSFRRANTASYNKKMGLKGKAWKLIEDKEINVFDNKNSLNPDMIISFIKNKIIMKKTGLSDKIYIKLTKPLILEDVNLIEYASDSIKNDFDFMIKVIKRNKILFNYASDDLKGNNDFISATDIKSFENPDGSKSTIESNITKGKWTVVFMYNTGGHQNENIWPKFIDDINDFNKNLDKDVSILGVHIGNKYESISFNDVLSSKKVEFKSISTNQYHIEEWIRINANESLPFAQGVMIFNPKKELIALESGSFPVESVKKFIASKLAD